MTAKEYLSQAYRVDQRINSKLEQIKSLHSLAEKATSVLSPTPCGGTRNIHGREDTITKMLDLEDELCGDIDGLLKLKREIAAAIACVDNPIYRMLLELRYLCFKRWEDIAAELEYDQRYVFKAHDKAIQKVIF